MSVVDTSRSLSRKSTKGRPPRPSSGVPQSLNSEVSSHPLSIFCITDIVIPADEHLVDIQMEDHPALAVVTKKKTKEMVVPTTNHHTPSLAATSLRSPWTRMRTHFTGRRIACWACSSLGVLLLIILVAALVLYFGYWVGMPTVTILEIQKPTQESANNAVIDLGENGKRTPSLSLTVNVNVRIDNPNKLDLSFSKVDIRGFHPSVPGTAISSSTLNDLVLLKQAPTYLTLPMFIRYSFADDSKQALPKDLVASCTIPAGASGPSKQLSLAMVVDATFRVVGPITVKIPRIESTHSFDCPLATTTTAKQSITLGDSTLDTASIDWVAVSQGQLAVLEGGLVGDTKLGAEAVVANQ